jgi:heat shock protein HslJ
LVACENTGNNKNREKFSENNPKIEKATLDGIWELYKVNDTIFRIDEFYGFDAEQPRISFNVAKQEISGFSGCNRFGGKAEFTDDDISLLEPVTATQIGCEKNIWETDFFNRLLQIKKYKIDTNNLLITGNDNRTLEFKRKVLQIGKE